MKWTETHFPAKLGKNYRPVNVNLQKPAYRRYGIGLRRHGRRMAAKARPIARAFGVFRSLEKLDLLRSRPAAGAGGTAIHARRSDRVDELPVSQRVSLQDQLPMFLRSHYVSS
jgi:hypothetical protein